VPNCPSEKIPVTAYATSDTVSASYTSTRSSNGLDFSFDASLSKGNEFYWDFGDGNNSTGLIAQHTYANVGAYNVCLIAKDSTCSGSDTLCSTIYTTIGIEDNNLKAQNIHVYPNPTSTHFTIELISSKLKSIEVYNAQGILIKKIYSSESKIDLFLDTSPGLYVLSITNENNEVVRKKLLLQ